MKKLITIGMCMAIFLSLMSCYAPSRIFPDKMPAPIYANVPLLVQRGREYSFTIETSPGAYCHGGITYWDTNDKWIQETLPAIEADKNGDCEWVWKIPENAKDGEAGFRGYVEIESQNEDILPATFCIEKCQ